MAQRRIAIIGSGFSGLCLGIQLKKAGIDAFAIFEKSDRLGGTWRDNTYPGAACDVPSSLYCFSFEQKTDWSRLWSPQEEIRDYMEHCARKYDLVRHIRFGTEIAGARFDAGAGVWRLRTTGDEEIVADVLVSAVGQLNRPAVPAIPGLDRFRGACFHSARWDHGADLGGNRFFAWVARRAAEKNLRAQVADLRLRAALTPDYPIGGKRILISDDYYPTLARDNVEVVTDGIAHLTEEAVVTRDGGVHPVDALILATGFQTTAFLAPMRIAGLDGRSLDAELADGARAYRGIAVSGFPNLFLMYGPNTNLGHNSIIFMIECQTRYVLGAIRTLIERDLAYLDLSRSVMEADDARTQAALAGTVWAATGKSWYKTEKGRITNNWSGSTVRYWWVTRRFDGEHYRARAREPVAYPAIAPADTLDAARGERVIQARTAQV